MALSLLFFFFSAQFDIPYSILFVQITLSSFSKFKITVDMSITLFSLINFFAPKKQKKYF